MRKACRFSFRIVLIFLTTRWQSCTGDLFLREHKLGEDYFTSVQSLTYLVTVENKLLNLLEKHLDFLREIDPEFEHDLYAWFGDHLAAVENPEEYVSHPITSYQLIKRLTVDWMDFRSTIIEKAPANFTDELKKEIEPYFPGVSDLNGAVHGISFLCSVYTMSFADFMQGRFLDRQYDVSLSVFDVLEMTYVSLTNNRIINACLMSIELLYRDDYPVKVLQESMGLYESVMKALNATGNYQMSNGLSNLLYRKFHNETLPEKPERVLQNEFIGKQRDLLETIQKKEKRTNMMLEEDSREVVMEDFKRFCAFCKYPNLSRSLLNKSLSCRYKTDLPFLKLSPLKMEELNLDPLVALFHDAISDKDIQFLKDAAIPQMQRAVVVNYDKESHQEKGQNYSDSRISETAWLNEGDHPVTDVLLDRLNVRIAMMTSRRIMTSESLQVNNYGLGGYFAPHFDALHYNPGFLKPNNDLDNREATVMFYMSDVEQGGSTVFLDLQLVVPPQKGAALCWYNLKPDRTVDLDTLHGACPVLVGSKWVCNKWIHRFADDHSSSIPQTALIAS
uniref:procollagen-proline 4-dioxygenase n=1 Tax=Cacopsylla melanoneura TaxID=428564 RepID=A0A8D8WGP3_9HEMI